MTLVEVPGGRGAAEAGLAPGDVLVAIDGDYVPRMGPDELRRRLRGAEGTRVRLTVLRGDEVLHVEVRRGPFVDPDDLPAP